MLLNVKEICNCIDRDKETAEHCLHQTSAAGDY